MTMTPSNKGQQSGVSRFFRPPEASRKRPCPKSVEESSENVENSVIEINKDDDSVTERPKETTKHNLERGVADDSGDSALKSFPKSVKEPVENLVIEIKEEDSPKRPEDEQTNVAATEQNLERVVTTNDSHDSPKLNSEPQTEEPTVNRFAMFAFGASNSAAVRPSAAAVNKKKWTVSRPTMQHKNRGADEKKKKKQKKEWIRMVDCSEKEQERIRTKWHSLADPNAPLEVRRFQVLVAARLHAQCQEPVVRKTMNALRQHLQAAGGDLDVPTLCNADPEGLAIILSSLQYFNTKAKHIVEAAKQIKRLGKVPETEAALKEITGIGPVLADVLAFVNTVKAHTTGKDETTS